MMCKNDDLGGGLRQKLVKFIKAVSYLLVYRKRHGMIANIYVYELWRVLALNFASIHQTESR